MQTLSITILIFPWIYIGNIYGLPVTEKIPKLFKPIIDDLRQRHGELSTADRITSTTTISTTTADTFDPIARLIAREAEDDYQEEFLQENKTSEEDYKDRKGKGQDADDDLNIEFRIAADGDDMQPMLRLDFSDVLNRTNRTSRPLPYYNRWDFRSGPEPEFDEDVDTENTSLWKSVTIPAALGFVVLVVILLILFRPKGYLCRIMVKNVRLDSKGHPIKSRR